MPPYIIHILKIEPALEYSSLYVNEREKNKQVFKYFSAR